MTAFLAVAIWALAANMVAMLPHNRLHFTFGFLLLLCFPLVLWTIGQAFGGWAVFAILLVGVSLYRLPLAHLFRYLTDQPEPKK